MKTFLGFFAACLFLFGVGNANVHSETQEVEGYTIFTGALGPQVCIGKWTPSPDGVLPGNCDGQIMGIPQLTAVSSRMSVDRLDKMLNALSSIDQKLAINNDQTLQLLQTNAETQKYLEEQVFLVNDLLRGAIAKRFDEIPEELLDNDLFREELEKLKTDILKEVEKHYSKKPAQPAQPAQ